MTKETIAERFMQLQDNICTALERLDGETKFQEDKWQRPGGGGGRSRVMQNGRVFEKGGVGFSAVSGETPANILQALKLQKSDFFATGVSIVIHPQNPMVPIIHMNVRYFEMSDGTYWFGGGIDLTPCYVFDEDAKFFHSSLKEICDRYDNGFYPRFKQWADDYFYIRHRNEMRGIGGIFFDRLSATEELSKERLHEFVMEVGESFVPVYSQIVKRTDAFPYGKKQKNWQLTRRGRYVEFNLVYDKGTKFGLDTNGRTESILMSMPPLASWAYAHTPEAGSQEEESVRKFAKGIDWAE